MSIRIKGKPVESSLQDNDAFLLTQDSSGNDKHGLLSVLATYVKNKIGNATVAVAGLMSAADKTKSDSYPSNGTANRALITDAGGLFILTPITSGGDMLQSVYDTGATGTADVAKTSVLLSGLTGAGNDKVWVTNGSNVQIPVDISSLDVNSIVGTPGNLRYYGTDGSSVKGFHVFPTFNEFSLVLLGSSSHNSLAQKTIILADDDAVGGAITINLTAAASSNGLRHKIKKLGTSGIITIDANGSETIDGALTAVLTTQYEAVEIVCNGTEWFIL